MRNVLRSAAFLGRSFVAEVLTRVAARVRPDDDRSEHLDAVIKDHIVSVSSKGRRAGDVTLSSAAQRMREVEEIADAEDEHVPPPPLKGSLEWRRAHGDRQ
jgi:hypothetical protein